MTGVTYVAEVSGGDAVTTIYLGGYIAPSRRLALRWLRGQALRCANALDPDPYAEWIPPQALQPVMHTERNAPAELRFWADDNEHQDHAFQQLATGLPYEFLAHDETCWYALTARPVGASLGSPSLSVLAHA
ncbi:hypothetical protein FBY35_0042 [Streptomyces sp. SLBN-118]|uniref:hypothetical protein n=1 Tax=Streptomyces sp. SLBN-118 TaxID=2768454 RepID=UPI00114EB896|nr:hypothetical protein [Streptomyces sp. SLBN-118]TQK49780.1 hypothetical protein FBY35_0042 [Streptomyces sp. SLBN-118]